MWTDSEEGRAFVAELSKDVVADVAPEELDLFDELVEEYFEDPRPPDTSAQAGDDALAFGAGEALVAATPAATAMVSAVVTYILTEVINTAKDEAAEALKKKIKAAFKPKDKKKDKGESSKSSESAIAMPATPESGEVESSPPSTGENVPSPATLSSEQLEQVKKLARKQAKAFGMDDAEAKKMADALIGSLALTS